MGEKKKVTIVILNYNGKQVTLDCLESVSRLEHTKADIEILLVDNGSTDGSVEAIGKNFPVVRIIANKTNLGFCQGNNGGADLAFKEGADYIMLLNNDTLVHPELVDSLLQTSVEQNADLLSPKIYFAPGFEFHKQRYSKKVRGKVIWYAGGKINWNDVLPTRIGVNEVDAGHYDEVVPTEFCTGCCMLVKRSVYEKIGLFDPLYFAYFEDADLSLRVKRGGMNVFYAANAWLWHKNASSFGGSGSAFQDYFVTRNRLIFGLRYASLRAKFALLRESVKFLLSGPSIKKRAISDAIFRKITAVNLLND